MMDTLGTPVLSLDFLAGALTLGYIVAGIFFLRFWRNTTDRLFVAFGVAFFLLALNQIIATYLEAGDERTVYAYGLRVLGFILILWAVIEKNIRSRPR
jgi:hypothetical protein